MDGGQVAITGFVVQAVVAVLDALASDTWMTLTIEPASKTDEFEKVDILWGADTAERHVQVKYSTRTFTPSKVKSWCDEIRARSAAASLHLVLVGVPSGEGRVEDDYNGVQVSVRSAGLGDLLDACSYRFEMAAQRLGHRVPPEGAAAAVRTLAGRLLLEAATGRTWSRDEFATLVLSAVPPVLPPLSAAPLSVRLFRTVTIAESGMLDERIVYEVANPLSEPRCLDACSLVFTDAGDVSVVEYGDGEPGAMAWGTEYNWGYNNDRTRFAIGLRPRAPVPPRGVRAIGFRVRRTHGATVLGESIAFQDPLTPTVDPQEARVTVIFPRSGTIEAPGAQIVTPRTATWNTTTGSGTVRIGAVARFVGPPTEDPAVAAQESFVEQQWARVRPC